MCASFFLTLGLVAKYAVVEAQLQCDAGLVEVDHWCAAVDPNTGKCPLTKRSINGVLHDVAKSYPHGRTCSWPCGAPAAVSLNALFTAEYQRLVAAGKTAHESLTGGRDKAWSKCRSMCSEDASCTAYTLDFKYFNCQVSTQTKPCGDYKYSCHTAANGGTWWKTGANCGVNAALHRYTVKACRTVDHSKSCAAAQPVTTTTPTTKLTSPPCPSGQYKRGRWFTSGSFNCPRSERLLGELFHDTWPTTTNCQSRASRWNHQVVIQQNNQGGKASCVFFSLKDAADTPCTWTTPPVELANGDAHTGLKWYLPASPGDNLCAPCPNGMMCDGLNFRKPTTTTTTTTPKPTTATKKAPATTKKAPTTTVPKKAPVTTTSKRPQKTCYSVGDPHFYSFAGVRFDNHVVGWQTLYEKGELKIEAQQAKWRAGTTGVAINRAYRVTHNGQVTQGHGGQMPTSNGVMQFASPAVKLTVQAVDYTRLAWAVDKFIYNIYVTTAETDGAEGLCTTGSRRRLDGSKPAFPSTARVTEQEAIAACAGLETQSDNCVTDVRMANDPAAIDVISKSFKVVEETVDRLTPSSTNLRGPPKVASAGALEVVSSVVACLVVAAAF